jgi:hypothetical protein
MSTSKLNKTVNRSVSRANKGGYPGRAINTSLFPSTWLHSSESVNGSNLSANPWNYSGEPFDISAIAKTASLDILENPFFHVSKLKPMGGWTANKRWGWDA